MTLNDILSMAGGYGKKRRALDDLANNGELMASTDYLTARHLLGEQDDDERLAQSIARYERVSSPEYGQKLYEQELSNRKAEADLRPKGVWNEEVGGFVYAPDEQNPQGRVVKVAGVTAKPKAPFNIPAGYRLAADGQSIERIPGYGSGDLKPVPAAAMEAYRGNLQNMSRAGEALKLLSGEDIVTDMRDGTQVVQKGDKEATGWKGYLPDQILNRIDPEGVDARAAIADIGSMKIHDRSGAAVSASEFPRLQPFIPSPKDDAETVKKKVQRFYAEYQKIQQEMQDVYGEDTGYKPLGGSQPAGKTIVREVPLKDGRIGVEYSDGTRGYK